MTCSKAEFKTNWAHAQLSGCAVKITIWPFPLVFIANRIYPSSETWLMSLFGYERPDLSRTQWHLEMNRSNLSSLIQLLDMLFRTKDEHIIKYLCEQRQAAQSGQFPTHVMGHAGLWLPIWGNIPHLSSAGIHWHVFVCVGQKALSNCTTVMGVCVNHIKLNYSQQSQILMPPPKK